MHTVVLVAENGIWGAAWIREVVSVFRAFVVPRFIKYFWRKRRHADVPLKTFIFDKFGSSKRFLKIVQLESSYILEKLPNLQKHLQN